MTQKHKQLVELELSSEQTATLDRWIENEFVYSTLKLEGADLERNAPGNNETKQPSTSLIDSLRTVTSLARAQGRASQLTTALLLKLHTLPGAGFRTSAGDTSHKFKPVAPEHLPAVLESACRWYTAESFVELNPIEQAAIVLLRLIDLQPFEQANERTALVAASLFTLRSELPPIIITPDMSVAYRNALDEGSRMNTKPMVETIAEAVETSLGRLIEQSK